MGINKDGQESPTGITNKKRMKITNKNRRESTVNGQKSPGTDEITDGNYQQ